LLEWFAVENDVGEWERRQDCILSPPDAVGGGHEEEEEVEEEDDARARVTKSRKNVTTTPLTSDLNSMTSADNEMAARTISKEGTPSSA